MGVSAGALLTGGRAQNTMHQNQNYQDNQGYIN
jgi:hypothetical protein